MRFQMVVLGVVGVLGCAVESQAGPINLFELRAAPDAASRHSSFLDDDSRVTSAGMSELTLPDAQVKWSKDQCQDGPCPTTVPEPTAAMLLAIGSGLAAVSTGLRRRQ